jgi:anti-sigma B factor antagonist
VRVVDVEGEVDVYTSTQLKEEITSILAAGAKYILLNLAKVEYLDSTGLGLLIGALKRLRENGGNLIIVSPSVRIVRVFEITGLYKIFKIYETVAEAAEKEKLPL